MKRILFTKSVDKKQVAAVLGNKAEVQFQNVIEVTSDHVQAFPLSNYSLIFTSVNAVDSFFKNGFQPCEDFTGRNYNRIYAVGVKTKRALRERGFGTFKVARNAQELSEFILKNSHKEKFLHFCGNLALDVLNRMLPLQNISYRKVVVYKTELLYPKIEGGFDAVCFFSPSGVRSFAKNSSFGQAVIFSIGSTTSAEIKKHTNNTIITSEESNLDDLLHLIYNWQS